jgi:hypothetical protein
LLRLFGLEAGLGGIRGLQPVQVVGGALRMGGGREDRPKISESHAALNDDSQLHQ